MICLNLSAHVSIPIFRVLAWRSTPRAMLKLSLQFCQGEQLHDIPSFGRGVGSWKDASMFSSNSCLGLQEGSLSLRMMKLIALRRISWTITVCPFINNSTNTLWFPRFTVSVHFLSGLDMLIDAPNGYVNLGPIQWAHLMGSSLATRFLQLISFPLRLAAVWLWRFGCLGLCSAIGQSALRLKNEISTYFG